MRKTCFCLVALFGLFAAVGCGSGSNGPPPAPPGVEVSGKIQLANGAPVKGGILYLCPIDGLYSASAPIQADGSFSLVDPSGMKSVVPGKYQVYVVVGHAENKTIASSIPMKYQSSEEGNSDVEVAIQNSVSDLRIRLKN